MSKNEKALESGTLKCLFNGIASAKILDFMLVFRDWDYSKQDIAKNSNVSLRHAYKAIDKLEKLELIKKTRTIGKAQMYQYNTENPAAQLLQKFTLELAFQECQKIADAQIAKEEQTKQPKTPTISA
jgi:hypothetical protein